MDEFLRKLPYFVDLSAQEFAHLSQVIELKHLSAGEQLFAEGSQGDCVYIIKEGQLEIFKSFANERLLLAVSGPGDVVGEMALLDSSPRMAGAKAQTNCELLIIPQEKFEHLLDTAPLVARKILRTFVYPHWRDTEAKLRQSQEKIWQQTKQLEHTLVTLEEVRDQLEVRVEERTAELAAANEMLKRQIAEREQAEKSQAVAEAANEAKSTFLAMMSHELRTPMNAVIGMTTLLLDTNLTPEQQNFTETIRTSGEALLGVINEILDFSKIEAGKLELESAPFDLRECIEDALDLLASNAATKELNLAYLFEPNTPEIIIGDATRLRQIIINLTNNALKFTEQGEVVVSVQPQFLGNWGNGSLLGPDAELPLEQPTNQIHTASGDTQEVYELHFAVRDTGIGIPKDRMERLFKAFSQVDASTSRRYGGTGLGLVISQRLCELMGGKIWVESEVGVGTTFHFTICAEAVPNLKYQYLHNEQWQFSGKRLLIIGDNDTNRLNLTRQAETWGMIFRDTASPIEALDDLRSGEQYDAAILDMQTPDLDGLELAMKIRQLEAGKNARLPLIMFTAVDQIELNQRVDFEQIGFSALLHRPLKPKQLYDALTTVFSGRQARVRKLELEPKSIFDKTMGQRLPLRILLAEDNTTNQQLAMIVLDKLGYRADIAANGLEVIEALERQPYDVVLMDMQMPEMDGLETTRQLRRLWPDNGPHIIAMTANATQDDRARCLEAGMDDYISKPMRIEALINALEKSKRKPESGDVVTASASQADSSQLDGLPLAGQGAGVLGQSALDNLLNLIGGDPELLVELIDSFLRSGPSLLENLEQSISKDDAAGLRMAAHSLKANAADFGAVTLANLCEELEELGKTGQMNGAADYTDQIQAEYARVQVALESLRENSRR